MKNKEIILKTEKDIKKFYKEFGLDEETGDGIFLELSSKDKRHKDFGGITYKKSKDGKRLVKGYATTPDIDWVQDSVSHEAIKESEEQLLHQGTNTVFYNHDVDNAIGKVIKAKADEIGLYVVIEVSKAKDVDNIWIKIKEGILSSFSIRFMPREIKILKDEEGNVVSYTITKMDLLEVSVVGLPMNKEASIKEVEKKKKNINKKATGEKEMKKEEVEKLLDEKLSDAVGESIDEKMDESMGKLEEKMKTMFADIVKESKSDGDDEEKEKEKDKKEDDGNAEILKTLADSVKALDESIKGMNNDDDEDEDEDDEKEEEKSKSKKSSKKRKGVEQDDDEEEDDGVPKKALKSVDDEDTCKFVLHAMNDQTVYEKLSDAEKTKAKHMWFLMGKSVGNW